MLPGMLETPNLFPEFIGYFARAGIAALRQQGDSAEEGDSVSHACNQTGDEISVLEKGEVHDVVRLASAVH